MGATGVVVETRVAEIFDVFTVFVDKYFFQAKMNPYSSNAIKITPFSNESVNRIRFFGSGKFH